MRIVVISKDQPEHIPAFEKALAGYEHIYVLDRPSVEYPKDIPCIVNNYGEGFLAGRMRDLGATVMAGDDLLFLDGDKVPAGDLSILHSSEFDCVLLGVRDDPRPYIYGPLHKVVLPKIEFQLNGCWTCGIFYRKELIELFRKHNAGRIFHPCFDGVWGDEDSWNGDIMNYYGKNVGATSDIILNGTIGGCSDPHIEELVVNFTRRLKLREFYGFHSPG